MKCYSRFLKRELHLNIYPGDRDDEFKIVLGDDDDLCIEYMALSLELAKEVVSALKDSKDIYLDFSDTCELYGLY